MLISKHWLQDFVFLPDSLTPEELALKLTMSTVEVEGVEDAAKALDGIVVGEITDVKDHSEADSLRVCDVDAGEKQTLQIVCGGSNLAKGMKVALGLVGAKVFWHGEGEPVELKKTKIRGVESSGMICASDEIGLGERFPKQSEKEILDLGAIDAAPGTPLAEALGMNDIIFDIDNKSMTHRPDLWGHYGMAREVAAIYRKKLKPYKTKAIKAGSDVNLNIAVDDGALCSRYMAVALDGITIGPSPDWMQARLAAVGVRPVNVIVDITNYVMFELGQPMHAFDADTLAAGDNGAIDIHVRNAKSGESLTTLDGEEHELTKEMLVIADKKKALAIAGVMGGEASAIHESTKRIVFESATFDAVSVRKTATALGIRTDSSARFEKSLDPANTERALKRAVELTRKLIPDARVVSAVVDTSPDAGSTHTISLDLAFLQEKIGIEISQKEIVDILTRLGFAVKTKKETFTVTVPTWRATKDIAIPEDIVEEVARLYGYDNIPATLPTFPIEPPEVNELKALEWRARELLAHESGFTETYNYSFVSPEWLKMIGIETDKHIALDNPIAKDRPLLRRSLLPNLFQQVEKNLHGRSAVAFFEIGRVYHAEEAGMRRDAQGDDLLPRQDVMLTLAYAGKGVEAPFYEVAAALRSLVHRLDATIEIKENVPSDAYTHPGRSAEIIVGGEVVGRIGEIHPALQERIGLLHRTTFAELSLNRLLECSGGEPTYKPVPTYPGVARDIAFVVDQTAEHAALLEAIKDADPLVADVELFDVYTGKGVPDGKKSMAYRLVYRAADRTLTGEEADAVQKNVTQALKKTFGAEVR